MARIPTFFWFEAIWLNTVGIPEGGTPGKPQRWECRCLAPILLSLAFFLATESEFAQKTMDRRAC